MNVANRNSRTVLIAAVLVVPSAVSPVDMAISTAPRPPGVGAAEPIAAPVR